MFKYLKIKITEKGTTLLEMLAAVVIFVLTVSAILGIFISAIKNQRRILATQELLNQTGFAFEYMTNHLRMAKKDLIGDCAGIGENFLVLNDDLNNPSVIKFLDSDNLCHRFRLDTDTGEIKEAISADNSEDFTKHYSLTSSDSFFVNSLLFVVNGDQPLATISLEVQTKEPSPKKVRIQTSISQRDLND